jgi:hypothetical protein
VISAEASYAGISATAPAKIRVIRPSRRRSLLRYSPALFALVIVIADAIQVSDPDLWGHIRFGQAALTDHSLAASPFAQGIGRQENYSYSAAGAQWHDPEWLAEITMASVYDHWGVVGLKCWKLACVTATFTFLMMALIEAGASPTLQLNLLILAALAMMLQIHLRPQLFTFAMLAATLAILARENYFGTAPLWLIPPLMILWSNLHGGYIAGLAAIAVYTVVAIAQDVSSGTPKRRALRLITLALTASAATLITPYGFEGWTAILHSVNDQSIKKAIVEWQPLWRAMAHQWQASPLGEFNYLIAIGLMAALAITFISRPYFEDLPMVAIALLMSIGTFISARNMPFGVIACTIPLARRLSIRGADQDDPESSATPEHSAVNQWLVIAIVALLIFITGTFSPRLATGMSVPSGAVAFMEKHDLRGNVLNDYDWGAYLIWHVAPESKLFIDGRCETVYPDRVLHDYLQFYFNFADAEEVLRAYPHDFVLIPPDAPISAPLEKNHDWKLVYRDRTALLFARADSAAAKIPDVPVEGVVPKRSYFP